MFDNCSSRVCIYSSCIFRFQDSKLFLLPERRRDYSIIRDRRGKELHTIPGRAAAITFKLPRSNGNPEVEDYQVKSAKTNSRMGQAKFTSSP